MRILHLFSGSSDFSLIARSNDIEVYSLDLFCNNSHSTVHYQVDFMDFNFYQFQSDFFDSILIGFPCNTFSKASGYVHFKNFYYPLSLPAQKSIDMLARLNELLRYFSKSMFIIENPVSAIERNWFYKFYISQFVCSSNYVYQKSFGHVLPKHTYLASNRNVLFIGCPYYRKKGRFNPVQMDNLTLKKRQAYPPDFCYYLIET